MLDTLMAILLFTVIFTIAVVLMGSVWLIIKFTSYYEAPRGQRKAHKQRRRAVHSSQNT